MLVGDIDPTVLRDQLVRPGACWTRVIVVAETGSTNADLAALARGGGAVGTVLITDFQSAGRGRQGRAWTAPPGSSIALSVLIQPAGAPANRWTWLPLLAGLAVVEGLRQTAAVAAVLKWPNDVMVDGRKICGILAERVETPTGPACVLGIGLNVSLTDDQLPIPTATSLALVPGTLPPRRSTLISAILQAFARIVRAWEGGDPQPAASYLTACDTIGRAVRITLAGNRSVIGRAEGIDCDGRLRVRTGNGVDVFSAGDVVHLR